MVSAITNGVKVSVLTHFQPEYSNPFQGNFVFSYHIKIHNGSDYTVKLLRRHWYIHDANGLVREVEGEGVVGQQPTLEPGQTYEYTSGCNLNTSLGKMAGTYQMERIFDGKFFNVVIPDFTMVAPFRMN
ncbi:MULTISPECIES: Co2+/Mg2+ efflux protein ApaG [Arcicella]|uniref:ApaG protein n=3 Tax=Arcicella TaxID=217140 RepID=A0A841ESF8_9BACT|nr:MULTISPECIES: Co2+/Mg2+ efflux protein ApaG [Arcicella]MBB6003190.1 ApaG protein [Arcicella rosea]MEA5405150.1 Co2+/Mg2+ efflux protein ApaG [Arcicella sp. DC2W]MEA5428788.1 Co2+/Mg2+ efflux protein ApaG [Arcicella sp. DC25W]